MAMGGTQALSAGRRSEGLAAWLDRRSARGFRRLAARREFCLILVGLAAFLAPAIHASFGSVPVAKVQDEFSYLLAADTFARGRLTNPTHPHWRHFENFQIVHRPTYMSKYPPGQGLALAAGRVLIGAPIHGVWLSSAAATVAVCWMLQIWSGASWALVGAVVMILSLGVNSYWCQGYCGGMLAVMGSALVIGGVRRVVLRPRVTASALLGLGVVTLANTRPFEGLAVTIPAIALLLVWSIRRRNPSRLTAILPAVLVIIAGIACMGVYHRAVTGSAWLMPYFLYDSQYNNVPSFSFLPLRAPIPLELPRMRANHLNSELMLYAHSKNLLLQCYSLTRQLGTVLRMSIHPVLWVGLLISPLVIGCKVWLVWAASIIALTIAAQAVTVWHLPHYVAPVVPVLFLFCIEGLKSLRTLRGPGPRSLRLSARLVLAVFVFSWVYREIDDLVTTTATARTDSFPIARRRLIDSLESIPGRHLVFVGYAPDYSVYEEWVYNSAAIDEQTVVLAHDLGPDRNRELIDYYGDRHVWSVHVENGKVPVPVPLEYRSARSPIRDAPRVRERPGCRRGIPEATCPIPSGSDGQKEGQGRGCPCHQRL
jgi:hypothetical protein